jgi:hypothetical protein
MQRKGDLMNRFLTINLLLASVLIECSASEPLKYKEATFYTDVDSQIAGFITWYGFKGRCGMMAEVEWKQFLQPALELDGTRAKKWKSTNDRANRRCLKEHGTESSDPASLASTEKSVSTQ